MQARTPLRWHLGRSGALFVSAAAGMLVLGYFLGWSTGESAPLREHSLEIDVRLPSDAPDEDGRALVVRFSRREEEDFGRAEPDGRMAPEPLVARVLRPPWSPPENGQLEWIAPLEASCVV